MTGLLSQLTLDDDAGDELEAARTAPTPDEIRARQMRELELRQRKYNEARAKIFGETSGAGGAGGSGAAGSGASTPRNSTPPPSSAGLQQVGAATTAGLGEGGLVSARGGRGRGRGGGRGAGGGRGRGGGGSVERGGVVEQQTVEGQQPRSAVPSTRELYDPNVSPRPPSLFRVGGAAEGEARSGASSPRAPLEEQAIRAPKGPDGSGRGGFGFARRGGRDDGEGGAPL